MAAAQCIDEIYLPSTIVMIKIRKRLSNRSNGMRGVCSLALWWL
ncbi:MAG: hypothetical protein Q4A84_05055 [Neisseria sp.]|nr:hypothetical protein [Neisseria sp.]MDO4641058.1 hypothetical protein [Neisseria sp.]